MTTKILTAPQYAPYELIRERWGIRGIHQPMALFRAPDSTAARAMVKKLFPSMSKEDQADRAVAWQEEINFLKGEWDQIVQEAFQAIHGRPYTIADYKVSGVARDEFDQPTKAQLRLITHKLCVAKSAANAHASAATKAVMAKAKGVQDA